jgi:hypothetical protein
MYITNNRFNKQKKYGNAQILFKFYFNKELIEEKNETS